MCLMPYTHDAYVPSAVTYTETAAPRSAISVPLYVRCRRDRTRAMLQLAALVLPHA